jgi:hypothetical protein
MDPYPDSVPEPDAGPGFVMTENCKILQPKKIKFLKSKIAIFLSLGLYEGCPNQNIQHFKT